MQSTKILAENSKGVEEIINLLSKKEKIMMKVLQLETVTGKPKALLAKQRQK